MEKYTFIIGSMLLLSFRPAYAYIDPGTGSMLIQVILGIILAGALTFKAWIGKIRSFLSKKDKDQKPNDER